MGFIIGLLTLVMVLDCIVLIFLVLIQLPKKDAGAGLAFGGSATDALFGAGKGNVLTNITKYTASLFFIMAMVLSLLQRYYHSQGSTNFQNLISQPARPSAGMPMTPSASLPGPSAPAAMPASTGSNASAPLPTLEVTNLPAAAPSATLPTAAPPTPVPPSATLPSAAPPAAAPTNPAAK
jgi:preprotein translocase subunit SecG